VVWRLVRREVAEQDGCLVVVTHQLQEVEALSGRVAVLERGRIAVETTAVELEAHRSTASGFTLTVRGLAAHDLTALRRFPGVRDIRVASQAGGEQTLEVWTRDGELPVARFIGELTDRGATLAALARATPLQDVLERLVTHQAAWAPGAPEEVAV